MKQDALWDDDVKAMEQAICSEGIHSHVTEVYSPPRVTSMAQKLGLIPGMALDLTTTDDDDGKPWDFNDEKKRRKAKKLVREQRCLVSPMCTAFSQLQNTSFAKMKEEDIKEVKEYGLKHLRVLYEVASHSGRTGFVFSA